MKNQITQLLADIYGESVQVVKSLAHGGGCISNTEILSLSNGNEVFLKHLLHYTLNYALQILLDPMIELDSPVCH